MRKNKEYVRYDVNDKEELRKYIKVYGNALKKLRLKWSIGIWAVYTAMILYMRCPRGFAGIADFAENLAVAAILGLIVWFISGEMWWHCVDSLSAKSNYLGELEYKYNNFEAVERERLFKEMKFERMRDELNKRR